jgi:hypothetical protein
MILIRHPGPTQPILLPGIVLPGIVLRGAVLRARPWRIRSSLLSCTSTRTNLALLRTPSRTR